MRLTKILFGIFISFLYSTTLLSAAPPAVNGVDPNFGYTPGGNTVALAGAGFLTVTSVTVGGTPAVSFLASTDNDMTVVVPAHVAGTVDIIVTNPDGSSLPSAASHYTYNAVGDWYLYVANRLSSSVTPIDVAAAVARNVIGVFGGPSGVAITPDAKFAFVACASAGVVAIIDLTTNTLVNFFFSTGTTPGALAITPDGSTIYVVNTVSGDITVADITDPTLPIVDPIPIPVGTSPRDIAIRADGLVAYVTNGGDNDVTVIDLTTNLPLPATIPVGSGPIGIAMSSDGQKAYVANNTGGSVTIIDLVNHVPITTVGVGPAPLFVEVAPNGTRAYITITGSNSITPINVATNAVEGSIGVPFQPFGLTISPDSATLYTTSSGAKLVIFVAIPSGTVGPLVGTGGASPAGLEITPDQAPTASFTFTAGAAGAPSSFDASASFSPHGTIATYDWNFGDGTTETTASATTTHVYTSNGTFTVTLRVTNTAGTSNFVTFTGHTVSNNGGPSAVTSQAIMIGGSIQPPSDFIGCVKKNEFINRTEPYLKARWKASPSADVAFYRIYKGNQIVGQVLATRHLVFKIALSCKYEAFEFSIAAVSASGAESTRVPIRIVSLF